MPRTLKLDNIGRTFWAGGDARVQALNGISLHMRSGEFVCVLGPTGCGKTTLLRIIAGLETPSEGCLLIDSKAVVSINRASTLVFQQYSLFPWMTVEANVAFPLEVRGIAGKESLERAREFLALVGLPGCHRSYPYELSGGMQQRVAIARALAYDPAILLMDEPFGALDERTRQQLQALLLEIWNKKKKTVIFVTHNIDEAITLADRIVIMASAPGRIIEEVRVALPRPRDRRSEAFIRFHLELTKNEGVL